MDSMTAWFHMLPTHRTSPDLFTWTLDEKTHSGEMYKLAILYLVRIGQMVIACCFI